MLKMYRSPKYRAVLAILASNHESTRSGVVLKGLGMPYPHTSAEYNKAYLVIWRLIKRGWVAGVQLPGGREKALWLTAEGSRIAAQWAGEAAPLVSIYSGAPTNVLQPAASPIPVFQPTKVPGDNDVRCNLCGASYGSNKVRLHIKKHGSFICKCQNDLTSYAADLLLSSKEGRFGGQDSGCAGVNECQILSAREE